LLSGSSIGIEGIVEEMVMFRINVIIFGGRGNESVSQHTKRANAQ